MKKCTIVLFAVLSICLMTGCSSSEVEELRIAVQEENLREESELNSFKRAEAKISEFDSTWDKLYALEYEEFMPAVYEDTSKISQYFSGSNYYSTLMGLKGEMEKVNNNYTIEKFHLFNSDNNTIEELIICDVNTKLLYITCIWQDNVIIDISMRRVDR